jgi:hypothetical protein
MPPLVQRDTSLFLTLRLFGPCWGEWLSGRVCLGTLCGLLICLAVGCTLPARCGTQCCRGSMHQLLTVHTKHCRLAFILFAKDALWGGVCMLLPLVPFDPIALFNLLNGYHYQLAPPFSCIVFSTFKHLHLRWEGLGCRGSLPTLCSHTCCPFLPSIPCTPAGRAGAGAHFSLLFSCSEKWRRSVPWAGDA